VTLSEVEVYSTFCSHRFRKLEENQDIMSDDIKAVREKLFDGMSDALISMSKDIAEMKEEREKWNKSKARIVRDVLLMLLGSGGIVSLILMELWK